jgi:hypothetical protein
VPPVIERIKLPPPPDDDQRPGPPPPEDGDKGPPKPGDGPKEDPDIWTKFGTPEAEQYTTYIIVYEGRVYTLCYDEKGKLIRCGEIQAGYQATIKIKQPVRIKKR